MTNQVFVSESVEFNGVRARVIIDAPQISDEVVYRALRMVATAYERLNGEQGTLSFGAGVQLMCTPAEVTALLQ